MKTSFFFSANKSIFLGRKKRQINLTSALARIQKIFIFPSLAFIQYSKQLDSKLKSLKDPIENSLHSMHDTWKSCTSNYLPPWENFSRFFTFMIAAPGCLYHISCERFRLPFANTHPVLTDYILQFLSL